MMDKHKIVIEMVVGRALPSASKLSEVLDEINRDIRMDFAHNDWYAEIKSVNVEKVTIPMTYPSADDRLTRQAVESGLTKEELSRAIKSLAEELIGEQKRTT